MERTSPNSVANHNLSQPTRVKDARKGVQDLTETDALKELEALRLFQESVARAHCPDLHGGGCAKVENIMAQQYEKGISFEEGDEGKLHDPATFNSIPGTCFEIGTALAVLSTPGVAGEKIDGHAQKLSEVLDKIYNTELGKKVVLHNGVSKTLKEVFNQKLLKEISPASDQIGRCLDTSISQTEWYAGEGSAWLKSQLEKPSTLVDSKTHLNSLTKMRMISAFGTVTRELMQTEDGADVLAELINGIDADTIKGRHKEVMTTLRHSEFDSKVTRARYERAPIIDGVAVKAVELQDAVELQLGFGEVYGPKSFDTSEQYQAYVEAEEAAGGRNGLKRVGQPIDDLTRPGNISEYGLRQIPGSFVESGLELELLEKGIKHGTGVNRWQVNGSYARQSLTHGFPAAGSHSGGTVDILLGVNVLSPESIKGKPEEVLPVGMMISSFMNYGGYHSFVETFPIAKAFAKGEKFVVDAKTSQSPEALYNEFTARAVDMLPVEGSTKVDSYRAAYRDAFKEEKQVVEQKVANLKKFFQDARQKSRLERGRSPGEHFIV